MLVEYDFVSLYLETNGGLVFDTTITWTAKNADEIIGDETENEKEIYNNPLDCD